MNQAGTITVDYKGNGSSTATRAVAAAGTYQFTAPGLADGTYTTTAKFTPSGGTAVSASLTFTVDTQAPTLRAGAAAQGPLFTRTLTFSENMDASTISAASILVSGPGITGTINPAQVIGGGATYTVSFSNPLTKGGFYTLQLASTIADLAGNPSGSGVTDSFQLIPDTTPPVVSSVTPAGIVASAVTSIGVAFNKAIAAASFTSGQVTITGPGGTLPTASLTVTATDPQDFTVSFPRNPRTGPMPSSWAPASPTFPAMLSLARFIPLLQLTRQARASRRSRQPAPSTRSSRPLTLRSLSPSTRTHSRPRPR